MIGLFDGAELITKSSRSIKLNETSFLCKTHFAKTESDSELFSEVNESRSEIELLYTESVADTNLIGDMSELQNGDLGCNPETLVTERYDESITQTQPHSSTVHTTTKYGRKIRLPNSNLSYGLGSPEFHESETLAYQSDFVDHELPKSIEQQALI